MLNVVKPLNEEYKRRVNVLEIPQENMLMYFYSKTRKLYNSPFIHQKPATQKSKPKNFHAFMTFIVYTRLFLPEGHG